MFHLPAGGLPSPRGVRAGGTHGSEAPVCIRLRSMDPFVALLSNPQDRLRSGHVANAQRKQNRGAAATGAERNAASAAVALWLRAIPPRSRVFLLSGGSPRSVLRAAASFRAEICVESVHRIA